MKFEEKMERLQTIVDLLEKNEIDIEEAINLYEEGLKLSNELDIQLKGYENKINEIKIVGGEK